MKTNNEPKMILCVDDHYDEAYGEASKQTLEQKLREIYSSTKNKYDLVFVKTLAKYNDIINKDTENRVALVLLDHELNFNKGRIQGPWIAKDLYKAKDRKDIRIIGLTVVGRKESTFGAQPNVVEFVSKDELDKKSDYLRNISEAIIEDYDNEKWRVYWSLGVTLLTLQRGKERYECTSVGGGAASQVLTWCLRTPNEWSGPFWSKSICGRATDDINSAVRKATDGRVWGLITGEGSPAVRCLRALVNPETTEIVCKASPVELEEDRPAWTYEDRLRDMEVKLKGTIDGFEELKRTFDAVTKSYLHEVNEARIEIRSALNGMKSIKSTAAARRETRAQDKLKP